MDFADDSPALLTSDVISDICSQFAKLEQGQCRRDEVASRHVGDDECEWEEDEI